MIIQIWMVLIFLLACKWTEYNFVPHFDVAQSSLSKTYYIYR